MEKKPIIWLLLILVLLALLFAANKYRNRQGAHVEPAQTDEASLPSVPPPPPPPPPAF